MVVEERRRCLRVCTRRRVPGNHARASVGDRVRCLPSVTVALPGSFDSLPLLDLSHSL